MRIPGKFLPVSQEARVEKSGRHMYNMNIIILKYWLYEMRRLLLEAI